MERFSSFIVFSFLHSSSLMDGKICRCGFSLIWDTTCFIQGLLGWLCCKPSETLSPSGPNTAQVSERRCFYNQHDWLDETGNADKGFRCVHVITTLTVQSIISLNGKLRESSVKKKAQSQISQAVIKTCIDAVFFYYHLKCEICCVGLHKKMTREVTNIT